MYWNQPNFEGLLTLAAHFEAQPGLQALAQYCRMREKGLRREAFSALEQFLASASSFDTATQRALAVDIFEANARTHEAHHLLNQPLMSRFLLPTLQAWVDEQPNAQVPLRWLGLQRNEHELLLRALALNPADTPVRMRLIDHHLSSADHATHHLDESHFIGEVQYALDELARAQALITGATEPERLQHRHTELLAYQDLIADWIAYSRAPSGSFPQWCADQGRTYTYPAKYYYR